MSTAADQHVAPELAASVGGLALDEAKVRDLKARLRGEVLQPGDDGYDAARTVWNAMIDRRPAAIARCASAADVVAAVAFAREHDLRLSVRGGGHNVAGNAVADRGLMLDLSRMTGIRVDPARRTARAEPGLTWGQFDRETHAFGLATTGGVVSTTGIAGLTLGGGLGWLLRKHGMVIDNLLGRRRRHRRRAAADGQRRGAPGPLLGPARRRRQLRGGHLLRVPPAPPDAGARAGC